MRIAASVTFAAVLLCGVARARAADPNSAPQQRTHDEKENSCWKVRYRKCDSAVRSDDLVFVFPRDRYKRNPEQVIKRVQIGWNLLKDLTGIDPVKVFGQRIVIGFRHPSDEGGKDCNPGWLLESGGKHGYPGENWPFINIPWGYLKFRDQPEECLTHEMVHAFIHAKPLRDNKKEWIEGMCDFLRLPVFDAVGMCSVGDQRYRLYVASAWKPRANFYHDYAGRLIRWCQRQKLDVRKPDELNAIVPDLWDMDLSEVLGRPLNKTGTSVAPR
jgi:hypothetical protein